jgi:hypothetical protein
LTVQISLVVQGAFRDIPRKAGPTPVAIMNVRF